MTGLLKTKLHDTITARDKSIGVWEIDGQRLAYLASRIPENGVIVEIGSHRGRSAAYMAAAAKTNVTIYCIDLWKNDKDLRFVSDDNDLKMFWSLFDDLGLRENIVALQGKSEVFAHSWEFGINLLFIDGDHSYDGVKSDYIAWYPHVRDGGVIAFHDYHKNWPGVIRFVDETASRELKPLGLHERVWSGQK